MGVMFLASSDNESSTFAFSFSLYNNKFACATIILLI